MTIRTKLSEDEFGNLEYCDQPIHDSNRVVQGFYGVCVGVRLVTRGMMDGQMDGHLLFEPLCSDDGHWFVMKNPVSTAWLPEFLKAFQAAEAWCRENARPDMHEGVQYGWMLKGK